MRIPAAVLLFLALAVPASSYEPEGYPGSTWGEASRDFDGIEGNGVIGRVEQGVHWVTLPHELKFISYANYKVRVRSRNRKFYNALGPSLGIRLDRSPIDFGFDFHWSRFPERRRTFENYEMFFGWYKSWDLGRYFEGPNPLGILAFPFSTWGRLAHDLRGSEGDSSMGNVTQGINWVKLPGDWVLNTFGTFRWRMRTNEKRFFNAYGPALGVEVERGPFTIGIDHTWQYLPELKEKNNTVRFYVTWYYAWDLKDHNGR